MLLGRLKTYEVARCDLEELVEMHMYASQLESHFQAVGVAVPEWLVERKRELSHAIRDANRDALAAQLKAAQARRKLLEEKAMTPQEKLDAARAEEARLAQLVNA